MSEIIYPLSLPSARVRQLQAKVDRLQKQCDYLCKKIERYGSKMDAHAAKHNEYVDQGELIEQDLEWMTQTNLEWDATVEKLDDLALDMEDEQQAWNHVAMKEQEAKGYLEERWRELAEAEKRLHSAQLRERSNVSVVLNDDSRRIDSPLPRSTSSGHSRQTLDTIQSESEDEDYKRPHRARGTESKASLPVAKEKRSHSFAAAANHSVPRPRLSPLLTPPPPPPPPPPMLRISTKHELTEPSRTLTVQSKGSLPTIQERTSRPIAASRSPMPRPQPSPAPMRTPPPVTTHNPLAKDELDDSIRRFYTDRNFPVPTYHDPIRRPATAAAGPSTPRTRPPLRQTQTPPPRPVQQPVEEESKALASPRGLRDPLSHRRRTTTLDEALQSPHPDSQTKPQWPPSPSSSLGGSFKSPMNPPPIPTPLFSPSPPRTPNTPGKRFPRTLPPLMTTSPLPPTSKLIADWAVARNLFFQNFKDTHSFPDPPIITATPCRRRACREVALHNTRALQACDCEVEAALRELDDQMVLGIEARRWQLVLEFCRRTRRQDAVKQKAKEVLRVVERMLKEEEGAQEGSGKGIPGVGKRVGDDDGMGDADFSDGNSEVISVGYSTM